VDQLHLYLSGSSNANIATLAADSLNLEASGGGLVRITGTVLEQDVSLNGGSRFKADNLRSEQAKFSASGGGDSTVWVTETLSVHLMGGSSLDYYGQPEIIDESISGGGELDALGARE
jgi:hypothetical protein